jgi:hypothetical protein
LERLFLKNFFRIDCFERNPAILSSFLKQNLPKRPKKANGSIFGKPDDGLKSG